MVESWLLDRLMDDASLLNAVCRLAEVLMVAVVILKTRMREAVSTGRYSP